MGSAPNPPRKGLTNEVSMSKQKVMQKVEELRKLGCEIEVCAEMNYSGYSSYLELSLWIHTDGWSFEDGDRSCSCYYDEGPAASVRWNAALEDLTTICNVPVRETQEAA